MHPLLEKEDQQLIDLLDAIDKCMSDGGSANQVYNYLSDFIVLAKEHFKNEEIIMEHYKYPDIIDHKKEHADLLKQLLILQSKLDQGRTSFSRDYMKTLRNWLDEHLLSNDKKLSKFMYLVNADSHKMPVEA